MSEAMRWFPLYLDRFLWSKRVRRMDAEQVGAFFLLLCEQWDNGAISDTDDDLVMVARAEIGVVREVLAACFKLRRKGWINDTLEEIRREQNAKLQRMTKAGRLAGQKSAKVRAAKAKERKDLERPFNDRSTIVERPVNENEQIRLEEKRLEEKRLDKKRLETSRAGARARVTPWRFCPDDWHPTDKHAVLAAELHVNIALEEARFRDHEHKRPKTDANRAFSNWLRNAPQYANGNSAVRGADPSAKLRNKADEMADYLNRQGK